MKNDDNKVVTLRLFGTILGKGSTHSYTGKDRNYTIQNPFFTQALTYVAALMGGDHQLFQFTEEFLI